MPLFRKLWISNSSLIAIWEITESLSWLYQHAELSNEEEKYYLLLNNELRKKHWLSVRVLLNQIEEFQLSIYYNNKKPLLNDATKSISISHSGKFVAIFISNESEIGIDIEKISPRINKLHKKFVSEKEYSFILPENLSSHLHLIWGAKEALYKCVTIPELDFISHLEISPFKFNNHGKAIGRILPIAKDFNINYEVIDEYMLVYAIKRAIR